VTKSETLRREHPRDASDAVMALSMIARCHYGDGNMDTGRFNDRGRVRRCDRQVMPWL